MFKFLLAIVLLLQLTWAQQQQLAPIVQLKAGKVQGLVEPVGTTGKVYLYQGIRYGEYQEM